MPGTKQMRRPVNACGETMDKTGTIAVWAVTERGAALGEKIARALPGADLYVPAAMGGPGRIAFGRLAGAVADRFAGRAGHVFVMSAGIAVRMIAPHLRHKTVDPAVVVADETGRHAISLLSGHIGGANTLAKAVAGITGAVPVITTATDLNGVPAIDVIATERGLIIENPGAIKAVSAALLNGENVWLHDPFGILEDDFCGARILRPAVDGPTLSGLPETGPGVFVDHRVADLPETVLVLRPPVLATGIGCNRNTPAGEIQTFLLDVLQSHGLSPASLTGIGTVDIKADEAGLLALAGELDLPLSFYDKDALAAVVDIQTPSAMVEKHLGVKSVCEAAAILTAKQGPLIVPKQKTPNVTVAVARIPFSS
jgi:cobalt-precorrin 5A hydrolase